MGRRNVTGLAWMIFWRQCFVFRLSNHTIVTTDSTQHAIYVIPIQAIYLSERRV